MHPKKSIKQTSNTPPTKQYVINAQILPAVPNLCNKINGVNGKSDGRNAKSAHKI